MRFLTLATHLLPLLALGGLASGDDNGGESLHRPFNDNVFDLNDNLPGNRNMNREHPVVEQSELDFTTVTSTSIVTGQPLLRSALDEGRSDSIIDDNHTPVTKRIDTFESAPTRQFSDDTDDNVPEDTTKSTGKYDATAHLLPVVSTASNTTNNHEKESVFDRALKTSNPITEEKKTPIRDSSASPSSSQPQFSDESGSKAGKTSSDIGSTAEPIITESFSNLELPEKGKPVISTDDLLNDEKLIGNRDSQPNKSVLSDSMSPEAVSVKSVHAEAAQVKEDISNNNSSGNESSSILNDNYGNYETKPFKEMKNKEVPDTSTEDSGTETSENWLSVLQSMVPSQKERLDFNEKMLQSIQNTVSNSNVNHNVMNNAPAVSVPCTNSIPPPSSNSYPDSVRVSPAGIPTEFEMSEEYPDLGIKSEYPYIEYTDGEEHGPRSNPDHFVDPIDGWDVQPIETQFNPVIHIEGEIMIRSQSQPMRPTRRCRRILMRPEPICKRGKPVCHTLWNGHKSVCKPAKVICRENPSQRPRVKLVCKRNWERLPSQRLIYSVPSYVPSDYELIDDQVNLVHGSQNGRSISEANDCEHEIPEMLPTPLALEGVPDIDPDVEDVVPDEEEDTEVSEEVFEEAIRKAINEAPEILAPEPNEGLGPKVVQTPRPKLLHPTGKSSAEVAKPSPSLVERKNPLSTVSRNTDTNNKADKLPVTQSELPLKPVIERETAPNNKAKMTNNSANGNINHNVNTNVNSNTNVNLNSNNVAFQPRPSTVQVPAISPVASPVIPVKLSKNNENSNGNANVNMNLNGNQNHNANVNDNSQSPVQPIVLPKPNKLTETSQADPTMPTFGHNTPTKSALNINAVNQNANIDVNSNTNINQQHKSNDQIEIPNQQKVETPPVKMIPQVVEPIVLQSPIEAPSEQVANNLQHNLNTNVNNNVNINHNNNVNSNAQEPMSPNIKEVEVISVDKNRVALPNVVLPSINQGNRNANVNANLNVNSNINKNVNQNMEPMIRKVEEKVPIVIPEPIQVAEPPVEVLAPLYEVPLLPALPSSSNVNSNVNQNINNNVNSNSVDKTIKSTEQRQQQQQLPKESIDQSMPVITLTKPTPKPILVRDVVSDGVADALLNSDHNINENSNRNVNMNTNQNVNHGAMNQAAQFLPETIPAVLPQSVLAPISANVPALHGNSNSNTNINHNANSNVNINGNGNAVVNTPELPNHDLPELVREPRPVAALPDLATREVISLAPVASRVSQDHNVNSNTNFNLNSNINNNANQMIEVPSSRPDPPIIKPVESEPVAAPNRLEIPLLTPAESYPRQDINGNANANNNINVNTNVNTNHNVNGNGNYDTREKIVREIPEATKKAAVFPASTVPTAIQSPKLETSGNSDVHREPEAKEILRENERTELNKNHNMDVNVNRNSNINVNQNLNLNRNNNIENQGQRFPATPAPATVPIQEPIFSPPQVQAPISHHETIPRPQVIQSAETNANYAANVNINHNSNSNVNFNQNHQVRGQEPILTPPLPPLAWIQQPVIQPKIVPNTGFDMNRNSDLNLNKNTNANINQNVNVNQNHNIVSRKPSDSATGHEYFNKNNYAPILQPDVREPVMIAAPTPLIDEKKAAVPRGIRDPQINGNHNANVNMNYNSNYNHNANYNGKAIPNENDNGNAPLINPHENVLPPVVIPQSPGRGTGLWNLQKNSNINANYNSNMNFNSNVNANSDYNSNIGQSDPGTLPSGTGRTRESNPGMRSPLSVGNSAIDTPTFSNIKANDRETPAQLDYNAQRTIDTNANYNSNLNYNSNYNANYNHNANYNAQLKEAQLTPKRKGWYELWYNNGDDKDGWTEIWNNKQFKRFLEQQLKDMKQQEDIQAQAQAQAFAVAR